MPEMAIEQSTFEQLKRHTRQLVDTSDNGEANHPNYNSLK